MIKVVNTIEEIEKTVSREKSSGKSIGLVPTMGYFHDGHLSLMKKSVEENDITITSLFVNPTQFGANEDLDKYPRDHEKDTKLADETGVDYLFIPAPETMYPDGYHTYVKVEDWSEKLCGITRPIHFRGVTTICLKLFNICDADRAYFGLKDAQQYLIINKMVKDLNMKVKIVPLPTFREADGLAMSSRNVYLDEVQRKDATLLYKGLSRAKSLIENGENKSDFIASEINKVISGSELIKIDYIKIVDTNSLIPVDEIRQGTLIALAAYLGNTRLIDNIII